jgi:hypothetical protein
VKNQHAVRVALGIALAAAVAAHTSCGGGSSGSGFAPSADAGPLDATSTSEAATTLALQVTPTQDSETVVLGQPGKTVQFHASQLDPTTGAMTDVTAQATWSAATAAIATSTGGGAFKLQGAGGKTTVTATLGNANGAAQLTVELTGSAYLGTTTSAAAQTFMSATPDPTPADAPAPEYPLDGVILPGNLPAIDFQWTQVSDNDLYRAHLTSPGILDVTIYTDGQDVVPDATTWGAIVASTKDAPISWTIDATGPSMMLRTSTSRTVTIASDTIDNSAIYVWQSSTGTFHVLDTSMGTDIVLPNNSASLQAGQPCSGCHRISRDGKRFAFTFNGGNFEFGTLAYDATSSQFIEKVAPSTSFRGTYATFNPLESTEVAAMIVAVPDVVAQNTAGNVRLEMHDPDTNAVVPSNLTASIAQLDVHMPGQATSMPDWSPDGTFVEFAAYDNTTNFVRDLGDDIVAASIVEAPVSYANGTFTFGTPKVLVEAPSSANPDTDQNNFLPAISPDGTVVAFTRAAGWWSIKTQTSLINLSGQIAMVRRSDGQVIELVNGSNGSGTTMASTWPQWAPTIGRKYAWLAYASERPYGHLLTQANESCGALVQGQQSCKQLWVTAIDLTKMKSGSADPSFAPFWIPGQSIHAQYVSPQWTKAVLPPPH